MMTHWHVETYREPKGWFGYRPRARVRNHEGKLMIDDLDPRMAVAIVAEHNHVIAALEELWRASPSDPPGDSKRAGP